MTELLGSLNLEDNDKLIFSFKKRIVNINSSFKDYQVFKDKNFNLIYNKNCVFENEENKIIICVHGKIYNLKNISKSYSIKLESTLIFLYVKFGVAEMLNKLNGDFVISIYDKSNQKLYLCRDRFGLRPIYYSFHKGALLFTSRASWIKEINSKIECDINFIKRFAGYHYRYIDNEPQSSPYKNIYQIAASNFVEIKFQPMEYLNKDKVTINQYWYLEKNTQENYQTDTNLLVERYKDLIFDSVKIRLDETSNPAFTLSGGMDSSTILANAVLASGNKQPAFSTVYQDETYDESEEISSMLDKFVSKWYPVEIEKPNLEIELNKMIEANDEPVATATWLSNFLMCKEIKKLGFNNLFGGLGGDELNAGEYEYFFYFFADILFSDNDKNLYTNEIDSWIKNHDHQIFKKNIDIANKYMIDNIDDQILGKCKADQDRLNRYSNTLIEPLYDEFNQPIMKHPYNSYLKNRTYQDIFYETVPCSIRAQLRNANYYDIQNYLPFFDYRLVEFMFKIPNKLKIKNGITKILLRKAMKNILPDDTRNRIKKTGWNAPAHLWFSETSLNFLLDLVNSKKFKERGIYNLINVDKIINEHLKIVKNNEIKDNHMMFLWQLVNLEIWFQKNESY